MLCSCVLGIWVVLTHACMCAHACVKRPVPHGMHACACMAQVLAGVAEQIKNFACIYLVDISEVPDFCTMYELYDPCTCMFFFRCGRHVCCRGSCRRSPNPC